jgi:peptidoglycan/xylan/chitin deacetylase (PgdA/CDA1 family)
VNVYLRRRLVALAIVAVVIAVPAYLAFGRSSSTLHESGPIMRPPKTTPISKVGPQLAAVRPKDHVPLPTKTVGAGPFVTVSGRTIRRIEAPHGAGAVALTFDDGPGPMTERILDKLIELRTPATFFVLGSMVKEHPDIVRDERAAGMVVANHTYTHPGMSTLPASTQRWQLNQTSRAIEKVIGTAPRFFRPPMWMWNATTAREAAQLGMITVLFSVDTQDYTKPGVQAIVRTAVHAPAGSVIAFHDAGGDRTETLKALPLIVHGLRARGLKIVTLDELYAGQQAPPAGSSPVG